MMSTINLVEFSKPYKDKNEDENNLYARTVFLTARRKTGPYIFPLNDPLSRKCYLFIINGLIIKHSFHPD